MSTNTRLLRKSINRPINIFDWFGRSEDGGGIDISALPWHPREDPGSALFHESPYLPLYTFVCYHDEAESLIVAYFKVILRRGVLTAPQYCIDTYLIKRELTRSKFQANIKVTEAISFNQWARSATVVGPFSKRPCAY